MVDATQFKNLNTYSCIGIEKQNGINLEQVGKFVKSVYEKHLNVLEDQKLNINQEWDVATKSQGYFEAMSRSQEVIILLHSLIRSQ